MGDLNYFSILCFVWAAIGIGSRFLMISLGKKWNEWELGKAYSEKKPKWIYFLGILCLAIVGFTWYQVFTLGVKYSWIIASLVTVTLVKVFNLLFNYDNFREFAKSVLNDKKKLIQLNVGVFFISAVFILLGIFLY